MSTLELVCAGVALFLCGAAAVFDHRRREIPNWLTLPVMAGAPIALGLVAGMAGVLHSVLGLCACAAVPLLLARRGAMGGGDVKLFAAIGALLGYTLAVEAQLLAFLLVLLHAIGRAARRGETRALLGGAAEALKRSFRRGEAGRVDTKTMRAMPLAPYVALGLAAALALELAL